MTKDEFSIIIKILNSLKEKGITILLIEHTMEFVRQVVDYVYVLNFGKVISQGSFEDIEQDEQVIKAYLGEEAI
jgi:ABC-type branched-subunit amino acid transport system ATPase component